MMLPKRNRSIPAQPVRSRIETPRDTVPFLFRIWNLVLLSYAFDGVLIAVGWRIDTLPLFFLNAEAIMITLMIGAAFAWQSPMIETMLSKGRIINSPQRLRLVYFFVTLIALLPIAEVGIRAGLAGLVPFLTVAAILGGGVFSTLKRGRSLFNSPTLPPRNLILRSHSAHNKNIAIYLGGLLAARCAGLLSLFLYCGAVLSIEEFLIFEIASLLLVIALTPSQVRFYSLCPNCRSPRLRALATLSFCPSCARKTFYRTTTILLCLSVTLLQGCAAPHSRTIDKLSGSKSAVIFVPGFKGTLLRERESQQIAWITAGDAFFGTKTLTLPLPGITFRQTPRDLIPTSLLSEVPLLGGIYTYDTYASTMRELEKIYSPTPVIPFVYDWRKDLAQSAGQLSREIDTLRTNGVTDITIIAHSMGGLITAYFLRYGDQDLTTAREDWSGASKISKVIFAGTPFNGAITICNDIQEGIPTLFNTSLLGNEALSTFPAAYQLMPGPTTPVYVDDSLKPLPGVMHSVSNWMDFRWGLFKNSKPSDLDYMSRVAYTRELLSRSEIFAKRITAPMTQRNPYPLPTLNLIGDTHDTMTYGVFNVEKKTSAFLPEQLADSNIPSEKLFSKGDLVVPRTSAELPSAYRDGQLVREQFLDADHGEVISSRDSLALIAEFKREALANSNRDRFEHSAK